MESNNVISSCTLEEQTDAVNRYENITQKTAEISETGFSEQTQSISSSPQTVEEATSYVQMDNYISILSNEELSGSGISNQTEVMPIQASNAGILKQTEAMPFKQNASGNRNTCSVTEPEIYEIINMNDLVNLSIYEDIIDKGALDAVSIYDNNTQTSCTGQLHKTSNKCKLALALIVGLVITVPVVSLIVWGVKSREVDGIKPAINLTIIGLTECWDKSVLYSLHCKNSNTTSENYSLIMRHETMTQSGQNNISPGTQKRTGQSQWLQSLATYSYSKIRQIQYKLQKNISLSNTIISMPVLGQSQWLQSLATYSYSKIRQIQYKLQKNISWSNPIISMQVIGEELLVGFARRQVCVFNRDGKQVRTFKVSIDIFKVIQDHSGKLIVASHRGLHIINNRGRHIKKINKLRFYDLLLHKSDIYALGDGRVYIFVNEADKWVLSKSRSNVFMNTRRKLYYSYDGGMNRYRPLIITDNKVYLYNVRPRKPLKHPCLYVYVYNLQGEFLQEMKFNHAKLQGVDSKGTLLIQTHHPTKNGSTLDLYTADGKRQTLNISFSLPRYVRDVLIDPDGNALWMWMWEKIDGSKYTYSMFKFIPI